MNFSPLLGIPFIPVLYQVSSTRIKFKNTYPTYVLSEQFPFYSSIVSGRFYTALIIRKNSLVQGGCFSGPKNEPCHRLHIEVALDAASHPQLTRLARINSTYVNGRAFAETCRRRDGTDFKEN